MSTHYIKQQIDYALFNTLYEKKNIYRNRGENLSRGWHLKLEGIFKNLLNIVKEQIYFKFEQKFRHL